VQGKGHEAAADLGGAVITGVNGNPLAVLARQRAIPMHRIDAEQRECPLYQISGKVVSKAMDNLVRLVFCSAVCSNSQLRDRERVPATLTARLVAGLHVERRLHARKLGTSLLLDCNALHLCNCSNQPLRPLRTIRVVPPPQASKVFLRAEEAALRVPEQYSAPAAEAISFGTFMRVQLAGKATASGTLAKMLSWLYTNAEFSAAAVATELSVTRWSDDDHFAFSGDHAWLPGVRPWRRVNPTVTLCPTCSALPAAPAANAWCTPQADCLAAWPLRLRTSCNECAGARLHRCAPRRWHRKVDQGARRGCACPVQHSSQRRTLRL
jgi:hypothetical protein